MRKLLLFTTLFIFTSFVNAQNPNIVFVLVDDLGYGDLGYTGAKDIPTPNIDQLANQGTKFTSAYAVHPFCGPSRMGLITGRYPHEFGAQFNLADNSSVTKGIPANQRMMSNMFQDAGYRTGLVGKWHLGSESQYHPNNRGFDDFYGFLYGGHRYFPAEYKAAYNGPNSWVYNHPLEHNGTIVTDDDEYITDELSHQGVRFINESVAANKPFFLFMSYNAPHSPLEAKTEDMNVDVIKDIANLDRRKYAAMVYAVDRGMKEIVDALKAKNVYNNTLIIFMSDNGGSLKFAANNGPLSGQKGDTLEGGFRVPTFFHWPNNVPAGVNYDYPITALDFYPTFAHLAGATIQPNKDLDGLNIWNHVVAGTNARNDNEIIMSVRHDNASNRVGIRRGDWKAYRLNNNQDWKLYNLKNDIGETTNLSATNPTILSELKSAGAFIVKDFAEPLWFHSTNAESAWNNNNMPNFEATFGEALSIDDENMFENSRFSFYPNPVKSKINFTINNANSNMSDVILYDLQGRIIQSIQNLKQDKNNSFTLQLLPNIPNGVYMAKVKNSKSVFAYRIVVSK
ncbi:sulfatase-like hydrolase/transferase [Polaribacter sp. Z022]|uniref:sulfatase-like hydrolase/transferase n=1 Tax=Polaribacter sp. Z022 TaxID=2927125 RepID=UPI0020214BB8|nr:sulfatase-like hydrolase/transferase [Polaribacter sp. Z022]MCL7752656.1 sulfatase-like hydrolase/transferase [Polaribacter sp. Z022]